MSVSKNWKNNKIVKKKMLDGGNLIFLQKMENQKENETKNSSSQLNNFSKTRLMGSLIFGIWMQFFIDK